LTGGRIKGGRAVCREGGGVFFAIRRKKKTSAMASFLRALKKGKRGFVNLTRTDSGEIGERTDKKSFFERERGREKRENLFLVKEKKEERT